MNVSQLTVTLHQLGVTEVRTYGRKEIKLRSFAVHINGERVGRISSFVNRKDRTPTARTRSEGVPYCAWYDFNGSARYSTHLRWQAVQDVVVNYLLRQGVELETAHRNARDLAQSARAGKPVAALDCV